MQFVANGPDIPNKVLEALEEGRLVLFCGAGVSMPAGLPSFKGLVEKVYEGLVTYPSAEEQAEWERESFDRVLNLLEGEGRFSPAQVRGQVRKILATPPEPFLDTHRAILDLSRDREGRIRLVTTNFDRLFEAADQEIRATAAPLLPVPKPEKWSQLVYLHGRLDEEDPEGRSLVLTSADFGLAYLVERWASRFVVELFIHYTVLFVGYGVNDPVMRYLIDAIAAERRLDDRLHQAYALGDFDQQGEQVKKREWAAKKITPVLYDASDNHAVLHQTLKAWAGIWAGGLHSKLSIVTSLAPKDPASLPEEVISQLCWAVADRSGAMAQKLADLGTKARLEWLPIFERHGLLTGPADSHETDSIALIDDGRTARRARTLDPVRRGLAARLCEHLKDPALARWAVKAGARLHPDLQILVRRKLEDPDGLPPGLRKVWLALTGSLPLRGGQGAYGRLGFHGRIGREEWSPMLRAELIQALSPCLKIRPSWASPVEVLDGEEPEDGGPTVGSILSFDCELEAGQSLRVMLKELRARPDWTTILADLAFDLTALLRRAVEIHAALDRASEDYDPTYIQHPSIAPHARKPSLHGWTTLIGLAREAYEVLTRLDPERTRGLIGAWRAVPYPVFRRLFLYAARQGGLVEAAQVLQILRADPRKWVWAVSTRVEFFACLPWLWENLDATGREVVVSMLLEGPPRAMFRADLRTDEWEEVRDHSTWERLARLRRAGVALQGAAAERLRQIEEDHPAWRLTGAEHEDFPTWIETGWGLPTDFRVEALLGLGDNEILQVLQRHQQNRGGLLDAWRRAVEQDRARGVGLLGRLLQDGYLEPEVWSQGLSALHELGEDSGLRELVLGLLERLPTELIRDDRIVRPVVSALHAASDKVEDTLRPRVLAVWDAVLPLALSIATMNSNERVTDAINHPTGVLAEALFLVLRSRSVERGRGIEDKVRARLEQVIAAQGNAARLGRVIVASRLPLLHDLDPEWTQDQVIPLFDWSNPEEAMGAWQGYLWSPWLRPPLWAAIKDHFLAAFDHVTALGGWKENLAALLASISIGG